MTAYFIDLTDAKRRALICADSLCYTVTGESHRPLGFANKVISFPHLRGAMIGAGIYEIHLAAAAALMGRPEVMTFDDVLEVLPGILRDETAELCDDRGIDPEGLMLFGGGWCGWNDEAGKFELVLFENYKGNYAPQRGAKGLIGIPDVPPAYVPPGFVDLEPTVRAMAGLRAIARFLGDHGAEIGMPVPLGGEISLTELRPDGISTRIVGRLDGFEQLGEQIADTWSDWLDGADLSGVNLVNRTENQAEALKKFEAIARRTAPAPGPSAPVGDLSRQQRRQLEKMERKASRKAA